MADYNEAIKNLQTIQGMPLTIRIAIEALEKQIPKKPIADKYGIVTICPHCNIRMRSQEITVDNWGGKHFVSVRDKHCKDCGQAIDWSDDDE